MDLIDNFRTFHRIAEYTFFSSAHGTFSRIDHILGHKSNLSIFKIEIISRFFSDHNAVKLDTWRLNNIFLNNQQVTEEIKRETKKFLETNDNKNRTTRNLRDAAKAILGGTFTAAQSSSEARRTSSWPPSSTPKTTVKRRATES